MAEIHRKSHFFLCLDILKNLALLVLIALIALIALIIFLLVLNVELVARFTFSLVNDVIGLKFNILEKVFFSD